MEFPLLVVEEMYREGMEMKRQQFRRENPTASDDEIHQMMRQWILDRPFDAPGRRREP